eukprot:TRINITY_DN3896_c0_g2_i1.p1 TRINITY_DN3896_c0_g2~~TRINITY_DN3896_c0_g2_i1.p1  ORF type:complete len:185 (-),score=42.70 TRINITY_DN3896_c0_g2_i1:100-654(-)
MNEDDVSEELDSLYMKIVTLSQDLIVSKLFLEEQLMNGFNGLARTRYTLGGSQSISALQIPLDSEFPSLLKLDQTECLRTENRVRFNYLQLSQNNTNEEPSRLRNRKEEEKNNKEEDGVAEKVFDPLSWFGVLLPRSLRESQNTFKRSSELVVDIANIQNEIGGIIARYKYLKRVNSRGEGSKK